jgi:DNA-binding NarL/FixJ family response regulator
MTIRVVVADDHALLRAGLIGIVNTASDLQVVGEAGNGDEAVRVVRAEEPDVVLMDIRMPGTDGLEATRQIAEATPCRVLILTTFDLDEYVYAALRNGASGFLLKDTPPTELLAAVRVIARGDALLAPGVTRRLIDDYTRRSASSDDQPDENLLAATTDREREVLAAIAKGLTNNEIARELHISAGTTKAHIAHLLTKLGARDRVHLVILAHQGGLADLRRHSSLKPVTRTWSGT